MIKALIIDFGGVIVRTQDRKNRVKLEKKYGLGNSGSDALIFESEMGRKAQMGMITDQELWNWIGHYLRLNNDQLNDFQREFWAGDVLDKGLVEFINSLRPTYQTAILSNATDALRETLHTVYPIAYAFDRIICSAEEKVMKPDIAIYEHALTLLDRYPDEVIFIDDNRINIEAARGFGMNTIHFDTTVNLRAELEKVGLKGGYDE